MRTVAKILSFQTAPLSELAPLSRGISVYSIALSVSSRPLSRHRQIPVVYSPAKAATMGTDSGFFLGRATGNFPVSGSGSWNKARRGTRLLRKKVGGNRGENPSLETSPFQGQGPGRPRKSGEAAGQRRQGVDILNPYAGLAPVSLTRPVLASAVSSFSLVRGFSR